MEYIEEDEYRVSSERVLYSVYIVELEDNHYFIYISQSDKKMSEILFECKALFEFPKIHTPICIDDTRSLNEEEMEWGNIVNHCVKLYMIKYGIPHVRGGAYQDVELSKRQLRALEIELNWINSKL